MEGGKTLWPVTFANSSFRGRDEHVCQMAVARFLDRMCLALRASGLWLRYATLQNLPSGNLGDEDEVPGVVDSVRTLVGLSSLQFVNYAVRPSFSQFYPIRPSS